MISTEYHVTHCKNQHEKFQSTTYDFRGKMLMKQKGSKFTHEK